VHDDISTLGEGKVVIIQATCVGNIIWLLFWRYMICHTGKLKTAIKELPHWLPVTTHICMYF